MEKNTYMLMQMICSEVGGKKLPFASLSAAEAGEIYRIARSHNMSHLVSAAITHNALVENKRLAEFYSSEMYTEFFRSTCVQHALEQTCEVLEDEGIAYIPLKGSVLKNYYPEYWMRSSTDIDILVKKQDHQRATDALVEKLGYSKRELLTHDITLVTKEGLCVELHFDLVEEIYLPNAAKILKKVWDHARPEKEGAFKYRLDDAMFYFYHIAHMAKHFTRGGCGIRPFLDIWLLVNHPDFSTDESYELLEKGGLLKFGEYSKNLSMVWFSDEPHSEITETMEEFVLDGGSFGNLFGKYIAESRKKGGKIGYFISHLFVPYKQIKSQYPIIEKYPILTPICAVRRWWALAFGKRKQFRKAHLDDIRNTPSEKMKEYTKLWRNLKL